MTQSQIASLLGTSQMQVSRTLTRTLAQLRRRLLAEDSQAGPDASSIRARFSDRASVQTVTTLGGGDVSARPLRGRGEPMTEKPTEDPQDKDLQDHTFGMNAARKAEAAGTRDTDAGLGDDDREVEHHAGGKA
jgi:hypothetical protein